MENWSDFKGTYTPEFKKKTIHFKTSFKSKMGAVFLLNLIILFSYESKHLHEFNSKKYVFFFIIINKSQNFPLTLKKKKKKFPQNNYKSPTLIHSNLT